MVKELNGWVQTDPDCLQYCKRISDSVFDLIEFWEYQDGKGSVHGSYIDLDDYEEDHIASIVKGYYSDVDVIDLKKKPHGNQLIAECVFESEGVIDSGWVIPADSFEHAEELIMKYIKEH